MKAPADGASLRATTGLVAAMWPLDASDAENRVRLAWLLKFPPEFGKPTDSQR